MKKMKFACCIFKRMVPNETLDGKFDLILLLNNKV